MTFTDADLEAFIKTYALYKNVDPFDEGAVERLRSFLSTHPGADEAPLGFGCEIAGRFFSQDAIDAVLWPDLDAPEDSPHLMEKKQKTTPPTVPHFLVTLVAVVPQDVRSHGGHGDLIASDDEGDFCPCGNLMHHLAAHPYLVRIIDYAPLTIPHAPECPEQLSLHPLLAPTGPTS